MSSDEYCDSSSADSELFRATVGRVKRLRNEDAPPAPPRPRPVPRHTEQQRLEVLHEMIHGDYDASELETGEELSFQQQGLRPGVMRKLRRGQFSIEGRLDLHGMTVPLAKSAVSEFIHTSRALGKRCVMVIHGKGNGSAQRQPVLKGKVNLWLQRREDVLAFCSARSMDGGTGAIYVMLRSL